MMKIAIYKPYKPILFDDREDTSSWSKELTAFIKLMAAHGHSVDILSETDYRCDSIDGVAFGPNYEYYDILFVSNGCFSKDVRSEKDLLFNVEAQKKVLLSTDLTLTEKEHDIKLYDVVLSQMKRIDVTYAHLEKLCLYGEQMYKSGYIHRQTDIYFAGHERDRLEDILEYVWRPCIKWHGKSKTLRYDNKQGKQVVIGTLKASRCAIVISDRNYYMNGFVTQRYIENCLYGCVNFVENLYDINNLLIAGDDERRVKSYLELHNKVCDLTKEKFDDLQAKQFEQIAPWMDGEKLYKVIIDAIR